MGYVAEIDTDEPEGPVAIDGTINESEVVEGDLIFTSRPGLLQDLCDRAGEPWRHVGIATLNNGVTSITEVSRHRFDVRPLDRVVEVNDEVAVARIPDSSRYLAEEAARWCTKFGGDEQLYAWHDVMLAGMIAVARHYTVPEQRDSLHRAVEAAAHQIGTRRPRRGQISYTCSAFIAEAFAEAGHPLELDIRVPRGVEGRPALSELIRGQTRLQMRANRPSTREYGIVLYALLAGLRATAGEFDSPDDNLDQFRWAMPGDLWRSPSIAERLFVLPANPP